jgi:hypothetical protein
VTAPWADQVLQIVEERIARLALTTAGRGGTVQEVATDRLSATVVVDGATLGVPVKVAGHVWPLAGDRVILVPVGPRRQPGEAYAGEEWCVVGVTSRAVGPNVAVVNYPQTTGTNTSSSIVNLPGDPSFTWTKRSDSTPFAMYLSFTTFLSVNNASVAGYLGFTNAAGTQTQYKMCEIENGSLAARFGPAHWRQIPDAVSPTALPAGPYTVNLMWARPQGPGTLNMATSDDHASALVLELGA